MFKGFWEVFELFLEVFGRCLRGSWVVFGRYWQVFERYLGGI